MNHRLNKINKPKKTKKEKTIYIIILILTILLLSTLLITYKIDYDKKQIKLKQDNLKQEITSHYNKYVITNKETDLYVLNDSKYIKSGKIAADEELTLEEKEITYKDEYLKVNTFEEDYYIYYKDIDIIDKLTEQNQRYKRYIVFNKNIKTKKETNFYDENNNLIYKLNKSFELPIIINKKDTYGVEINNRLLYVKQEDVLIINDAKNTSDKPSGRVRTLVYHRIYDPKTETCNQIICHTESQFESHIKYLKDNNFLTLTMKELEYFIDGYINIPIKSTVITIDDGTMDKRAIPILEKYQINATLFLVTSRFKEQDYIDFTSDYLELHSHTHNMHWAGECAGYGSQGGGILCLPVERVLSDLKSSREMLNGSTVFCYPFYDYNKRAIDLLQQSGFTMAFAGTESTNGYAYVGTNKMLIPRITLNSYTTFEQFKKYITN